MLSSKAVFGFILVVVVIALLFALVTISDQISTIPMPVGF